MKKFAIIFLLFLTAGFDCMAEDLKVRVGVILPLRGDVGPFGRAFQNGFILANEDSEGPATQCSFIYEDSEHSNAKALSAYRKLTTIDNIKVLYVFGAPMAEALAPIAERQQLPLLTNHIEPSISKGRKFILRYANSREEIGKTFSDYIVSSGLKKVGLVHTENSWFNNIIMGIRESAQDRFEIADIAVVNPDDTDMNTAALKLAKANVDSYLLFVYPGQLSNLARSLAPYQKSQQRPILGAENVGNPKDIEAAHAALEGAIFPTNDVSQEFRKRYIKRFVATDNIRHAAEGFDVAQLIGKQVCSSRNLQTSHDVMQRLASGVLENAAQGTAELRYGENGDRYFSAPLKMFQVRNGSVVGME